MGPIRAIIAIASLLFCSLPGASASNATNDFSRAIEEAGVGVVLVRSPAGGSGTGVLFDDDGHVATSAQIVRGARMVEVIIGGESYPASIVTIQTLADLAVLRLTLRPPRATPVQPAPDSASMLGSPVFALSLLSAKGDRSLSVGHVTALRTARILFGGLASADLVETDVGARAGFLGAPLLDPAGRLVGVLTGVPAVEADRLAHAVSVETLRRLVDEKVPWSGIEAILVSGELAALLNLPQPAGLLVQHVHPETVGSRLGLRGSTTPALIGGQRVMIGGDVILQIGDVNLAAEDAGPRIISGLRSLSSGDRLPVVLLRRGERVELEYVIEDP